MPRIFRFVVLVGLSACAITVAPTASGQASLTQHLIWKQLHGKALMQTLERLSLHLNGDQRVTTGVCPSNTLFTLTNVNSGKLAEVYHSQTGNGANVDQWARNNTATQIWCLPSSIVTATWIPIRNDNSGKCLDVYNFGTSNGTNVQQWSCSGKANQLWSFYEDQFNQITVTNKNSGKCLEVYRWATNDGGNVDQWSCLGQANQLWR